VWHSRFIGWTQWFCALICTCVLKKSYFIFPITKGSADALMKLAGFCNSNRVKNHCSRGFSLFGHNRVANAGGKNDEAEGQSEKGKRQRKKGAASNRGEARVRRRDGPVRFFVRMRFNITIVLCFAPSPFPRNCRTARASDTSSPSGPWPRSRGRERSSRRPARRPSSSATTPSRPSRRSTWKWARTTTAGRGPSAPSPPCTRRRRVSASEWCLNRL